MVMYYYCITDTSTVLACNLVRAIEEGVVIQNSPYQDATITSIATFVLLITRSKYQKYEDHMKQVPPYAPYLSFGKSKEA
jgi:hypothetical protein